MRDAFGDGPFGPGRGRGRGRQRGGFGEHPGQGPGGRRRRGDIRVAVLVALADEPAHGYEIIRRLAERTGGRWKPSPGSVYPTLQFLEEGGLVTSVEQDDKKVYSITEAGQAELKERLAEFGGRAPWMEQQAGGAHGDLRRAMTQLALAAKQVAVGDDEAQIVRATEILGEARKELYRMLAES